MDFPSFSEIPSNISILMAVKMDKISLECSWQATGLSCGFYNIFELMLVIHIVLQEAHLTVKK
jgi:hypothetical protein